MHKRGLVDEPKAVVWPSEEKADGAFKVPPGWAKNGFSNGYAHFHMSVQAHDQVIPVKKDLLGWQPEWDQKRFMANLEDEVRDALESDISKSGIQKMVNAVTGNTE
ncbi:hypothetical protein F5Y18DRAFT_437908 [Xylariaceae sp. FL1019]|nr:hypothetical protein F5Y18DRAFT_437908 [Xylariaceae sp. FL1019]